MSGNRLHLRLCLWFLYFSTLCKGNLVVLRYVPSFEEASSTRCTSSLHCTVSVLFLLFFHSDCLLIFNFMNHWLGLTCPVQTRPYRDSMNEVQQCSILTAITADDYSTQQRNTHNTHLVGRRLQAIQLNQYLRAVL